MRRPGGFRRVDRITDQVFASVIRAYLVSPKFNSLSASTQEGYRVYLKVAEHPDVLGKIPIGVIRPALVQGAMAFLGRRFMEDVGRIGVGPLHDAP